MLRRDERGTLTPILAVSISALVAASLLGANAASVYAVRHETNKAADLAALAGAANIPLIGAFSAGEPGNTACAEATSLLGASRFANALAVTKIGLSCSTGVTVDALVDWTTIDKARNALASFLGTLGLNVPNICAPLVQAALDPYLLKLAATDCQAINDAIHAMPDNLSPATATPRVRVTVSDSIQALVPLPGFDRVSTVHSQSIARRRFKNVIVLPAVTTSQVTGIVTPVSDAVSGAPMPLDSINPNATVADVDNLLMPAAWNANAQLGKAVNPYMPPGTTFDLTQVLLDAQDLADPPLAGTGASPLDIAIQAARTGDPVVLLRLFRMPVLGIPALDFTAAYLQPLANGSFRATPIPLSDLTSARGLFAASLVG